MPSNHLILCRPLLILPSIFPSTRVFSNESALWPQVAKVLDLQLQHQSFQWTPRTDLLYDGLVGSPCCPSDSQESSTLQFKSINSLALSFLYSPTLTSIHDHWKNHSLDEMDLCWQSNVSPFYFFYLFIFSFTFISWRLITLQYCSGFFHTLTWISHGFTCIPYPDPPSHLPLYRSLWVFPVDTCLSFLICCLGWS